MFCDPTQALVFHRVEQPEAIVLFGLQERGRRRSRKRCLPSWLAVRRDSALGARSRWRWSGRRSSWSRTSTLLELPEAVVFLDEVEDIASIRLQELRVSPNITNEFLKQIPRMRVAPHHFARMHQHSVGILDSAFLRPGRFDYVCREDRPTTARASIWERHAGELTDEPRAMVEEFAADTAGRRALAPP